MKDDSCIFCKIVAKEIPAEIVHETEDVIAFLDINPKNFGHTLVLPKRHFENIYSLPSEVIGKVFVEAKLISNAVKKAMNAEGINVYMNNDSAAGQDVFHAHVHIIPRFGSDKFTFWPSKKYETSEKMKEAGGNIRNSLTETN